MNEIRTLMDFKIKESSRINFFILSVTLVFIAAIICLKPISGRAEIYQYTKNGVKCFTDDISQVPENQLSSVTHMTEIATPPAVENKQNPGQSDKIPLEGKNKKQDKVKLTKAKEAEKLTQLRKKLYKAFKALEKRKIELKKAVEKKMTSSQMKLHNRLVKKLNEDSLKYMKEKENYEKRVNAYKSGNPEP